MALNQQEQEIVLYGKENGKSPDAILQAISKYRQQQSKLTLNSNGAKPTYQEASQETNADLKQVGTDVKTSLAERNANIESNKQLQATGQQGSFRTGMQNLGQVLGFGADVIGDTVKGGVKALLPQNAEDTVTAGLSKVATPVIQSAPVQSLIEKYENLKSTNPSLAADIDGALGLAEFAGNFVGLEGASVGTKALAETGEQAVKKGVQVAKSIADDATIKLADASVSARQGIGGAVESTGQKIQTSVIKPSVRDVKDGFKVENVTKYDVGGSLPETIAKSHTKMNELTQELSTILKDSNSSVNLNTVYDDTVKALLGEKTKSFGDNSAIERVLKNLKSEITGVAGENGLVNLTDATNVKRGAGTKGAWAYNRPESDASAIEKVYTEFYSKIKDRIEKAAPDGVKEINKQISELIPISNAALRRMTVEERNNILNITDAIGLTSAIFDPKALLILGANKAARSGSVGDFLSKVGKKIKG